MIVASPLLGMGPYGFLANYDRFFNVNARFNTPPPSNAHNLVLELAVDYGLIGLGLFLALLVLLWWPIVRTAWLSVLRPGTQLAVLGSGAAFAAQGFVEYFLGTLSILFAFWLLCGLAQVDSTGI